jgi:hypothetical protein
METWADKLFSNENSQKGRFGMVRQVGDVFIRAYKYMSSIMGGGGREFFAMWDS